MQQALEGEENKGKQEHRQRLKLESSIQELDEKFDRESKVCVEWKCIWLEHGGVGEEALQIFCEKEGGVVLSSQFIVGLVTVEVL